MKEFVTRPSLLGIIQQLSSGLTSAIRAAAVRSTGGAIIKSARQDAPSLRPLVPAWRTGLPAVQRCWWEERVPCDPRAELGSPPNTRRWSASVPPCPRDSKVLYDMHWHRAYRQYARRPRGLNSRTSISVLHSTPDYSSKTP